MTSDQIRALLIRAFKNQNFSPRPNESILDQMDSVQALGLVMILEDTFGITVAALDLTASNFTSIDTLVSYIDRKLIG